MSIATRLKRLEGDGGDRCLVCGYGGDGPTEFRIVTSDETSPFYTETILPEPDRCPACGRADGVFTMDIRLAYDDPLNDDEESMT